MFWWRFRQNLLLNIAKILNVFAFVFSLIIMVGGLASYDWSRMPYSTTSEITHVGALFSISVFIIITSTSALSFYVLRRMSKETLI